MVDLNTLPLPELFRELTKDGCLTRLIEAAREEDLGEAGDITTQSLPTGTQSIQADVVVRNPGVISGLATLPQILSQSSDIKFSLHSADGNVCGGKFSAATLSGPLGEILAIERIMLNLIGSMSGIATLTRKFVDAVSGMKTKICDTRKTPPGMRNLAKYAVRCGGGTLHRLGLFDAALFKDNHLASLPENQMIESLISAIQALRQSQQIQFIEIEVDSLDQLSKILELKSGMVDIILLDNMSVDNLRRAIAMRDKSNPQIQLEASGGISLENVRSVAETGVDRIAVGAITHSAPWLDVGLDVRR